MLYLGLYQFLQAIIDYTGSLDNVVDTNGERSVTGVTKYIDYESLTKESGIEKPTLTAAGELVFSYLHSIANYWGSQLHYDGL